MDLNYSAKSSPNIPDRVNSIVEPTMVEKVNRDDVMDEIMKLEEVNLIQMCIQSYTETQESKVG